MSYINANSSEDVVVVFDPEKPPAIASKDAAERIAQFGFLPFMGLLVVLWLSMFWLFKAFATRQPQPLRSFLKEALRMGAWWMSVNFFASTLGEANLGRFGPFYLPWWRLKDTDMMLFFLSILVVATFLALAFLPSLRPHRVKFLLLSFGVFYFSLLVVFAPLGVGILAMLVALLLSSFVLWLQVDERKLTYWHCLLFSLIFWDFGGRSFPDSTTNLLGNLGRLNLHAFGFHKGKGVTEHIWEGNCLCNKGQYL